MKINIYLISTVHKEKGHCNSESLFEILNKIKPEVIFCETSQQMFESFRKGIIQSSLEFNSIEKLSRYHSFSFVAVDSFPAPSIDFRKQVQILFHMIDQDEKYSNAWRKNNEKTHLVGFEYLNSDESIQIFNEMNERERYVINQMDNLEYKKVYGSWLNIIDKRENEMLENINSYVEVNEFKNAVFLCGAAHRKAFFNKFQVKKNVRIKWNFELPNSN